MGEHVDTMGEILKAVGDTGPSLRTEGPPRPSVVETAPP